MPAEPESIVRVNVKLAPGTDKTGTQKVLAGMPGVVTVIQMFPDEIDQELAGLYLLEVESSQVLPVLHELPTLPGVEYAEEVAPRKLIRRAPFPASKTNRRTLGR